MNYVITVEDIPQSVQYAERCIESAAKHGLTVKKFSAITPRNTQLREMLDDEGISAEGFIERYSRLDNCVAAFLSHYSLWKLAATSNTPTTIFDSVSLAMSRVFDSLFFKALQTTVMSLGSFDSNASMGNF